MANDRRSDTPSPDFEQLIAEGVARSCGPSPNMPAEPPTWEEILGLPPRPKPRPRLRVVNGS